MGNPMGEDARFATAPVAENQYRAIACRDRLLLSFIYPASKSIISHIPFLLG